MANLPSTTFHRHKVQPHNSMKYELCMMVDIVRTHNIVRSFVFWRFVLFYTASSSCWFGSFRHRSDVHYRQNCNIFDTKLASASLSNSHLFFTEQKVESFISKSLYIEIHYSTLVLLAKYLCMCIAHCGYRFLYVWVFVSVCVWIWMNERSVSSHLPIFLPRPASLNHQRNSAKNYAASFFCGHRTVLYPYGKE